MYSVLILLSIFVIGFTVVICVDKRDDKEFENDVIELGDVMNKYYEYIEVEEKISYYIY